MELGRDTARILRRGYYRAANGEMVNLYKALQNAVNGTQTYPPNCAVPRVRAGKGSARFEVVNETTLAAAHRLVDAGQRAVALNFASATHPGGGFLSGARAQEESLARNSALYACLQGNPMYEFHQAGHDAMYTDYAIYSPDVPVIRTDDGELIPEPWLCSFITAPAPNADALRQSAPARLAEIPKAFERRIHRVLAIAVLHGHAAIVLGAWGCGAFGNDTNDVASLFAKALRGPFRGVFARVIFAITDSSKEKRFIGPFEKAFGATAGSLP